MKTYLRKKTGGFWLTLIAAILAVIGALFYLGFRRMQAPALALTLAVAAVELVYIIVSAAAGNKPAFNLASTLCALLLAGGIMVSLPSQIDGFGYLVAGLYTFDDVRGGVFFLIPAVVALLLDIIASFTELGKE